MIREDGVGELIERDEMLAPELIWWWLTWDRPELEGMLRYKYLSLHGSITITVLFFQAHRIIAK